MGKEREAVPQNDVAMAVLPSGNSGRKYRRRTVAHRGRRVTFVTADPARTNDAPLLKAMLELMRAGGYLEG